MLLLFNATHLVTAWAPVVVMAHSIAPAIKNCFEIFITLFPLYVHIDSCFGGQSPQNPKGRLFSAFFRATARDFYYRCGLKPPPCGGVGEARGGLFHDTRLFEYV